jgi:Glyoxalase/Bleomycin resistance protein/Dioxygenase superfamily
VGRAEVTGWREIRKTTILTAVVFLAVGMMAGGADEPARPHITGIAHMALFVHDVEKSRAFYHDFPGHEEPYLLNNPDGSLSMTFSKVNGRQYIEIFPERAPGTDRLSHISIEAASGTRVSTSPIPMATPSRS